MACEYCENGKELVSLSEHLSFKRDMYPGISACVDDGKLTMAAIADVYEPNYTEAEVKINFCPMCGEEL